MSIVCFNVRQARLCVLQVEPWVGPIRDESKAGAISGAEFYVSLGQRRGDQCENFRRLEWFGKRANSAQFTRFGEYLWVRVPCNKHDWDFRLMLVNVFDYLQSVGVTEKEIDNK